MYFENDTILLLFWAEEFHNYNYITDNAYDPDVRAKQFWIDWTHIKNLDCLSFMDNGTGMTRAKLHKMLRYQQVP